MQNKERVLKVIREKTNQVKCKVKHIRITADFHGYIESQRS